MIDRDPGLEAQFGPLADDEEKLLVTLVETIHVSMAERKRHWRVIAGGLQGLCARRLYKTRARTLEEFVEREFGMSRQRAYQLLKAAKVFDELEEMSKEAPPDSPLSTAVDNIDELTERAARPMFSLGPEQRREAWSKAYKTAGPGRTPTSVQITAAAQEVVGVHVVRPASARISLEPPSLLAHDFVAALDHNIDRINAAVEEITAFTAMLDRKGRWSYNPLPRAKRGQ
jgi:hypothetical protein